MKKVLLIFPKTGFDPIKPRMPSSYVYLGTVLKQLGYTPIIVDERVEQDYKDKIKYHIKDSIAVGLTAMTGRQINYALSLAKFVREISNKKIIWGGIHASLLPEQTLQNKYVDIVIKGEGEFLLPKVIKMIERGKKVPKIVSSNFIDLKDIPSPDWSLIDTAKYRVFDVQSSRGCPYRCTYCYNPIYNKRIWRPKPKEKLIKEIEDIKLGAKEINFIDDNFFTDIKRTEWILKEIIRKKLKFTWRTNCRVSYFDKLGKPFLDLAYKAGLRELQFGCESGSQRILDLIKKDITVSQIENAINKVSKSGIQSQCAFMIGFPFETKEDNKKTFELIDRLRKHPNVLINMISIFTPCPGSKLFEESKKYGYIPPSTLESWGDYSYTNANVSWLTGKKKQIYESITYISRFCFYNKQLKKKFITPKFIIPYYFLRTCALLRWKFKYFNHPWEFILFKKFVTRK